MCEMELLPEHYRTVKSAAEFSRARRNKECLREEPAIARHLFLQGQLRYIEDWNAVIFLCNPL